MIYFRNAGAIDCRLTSTTGRFNAKNFTLACWINRSGVGTNVSCGTSGQLAIEPVFTHGIGESETRGLNCNWFLGFVPVINSYGCDFEDFNNGLNHPFNFSGTITNGVPYHICVTYHTGISTAGATIATGYWSGYINGILSSQTGVVGTSGVRCPEYISTQGVGIGTAINSSQTRAGAFNGVIWDVAMWNDALSSGEVFDLANTRMNYMPLQFRPDNLMAYFPLDETPNNVAVHLGGQSIRDRGPSQSGATMFGAATGLASHYTSY